MSDFGTILGQRVLVCDGAMGTMLHAAGNSLDRALPELNLSDADLVSTIHGSYIEAGVDMIQTNTFGANRLRLAEHGFGGMVREINVTGVQLARQARDAADRTVFVAGSVSPAVSASVRRRTGSAQRVEAIQEQVEALAEGGVDVLLLETFGYLDELVEAIEVAGDVCAVPIVAQATFADDGHTLGGESVYEVASTLNDLPIAMLGTNCTLGPQGVLAVVGSLRRHTTLPVSAQPNAGLPRRVAGRRFEYNIDAPYFVRYARRFVEAGAALIGGCCGTTPTQIRSAAAELATVARDTSESAGADHGHSPTAHTPVVVGEGELAERLAAGRFVVAMGLAPPRGGVVQETTDQTEALRGRGHSLFFIASRESARAQLNSISLALQLQQHGGVETIATATTWDKTIMTLQADLLGAHALGLRSVVCETGNPPLLGDYPNVDGIWDVDSVGLIELLADLNRGRDCTGLPLTTKTSFCIGARFNPNAQDVAAEVDRTRAKIHAGAQFLVTRPVYEFNALQGIVDELASERVPILLCVQPLSSFEEADYLAHEVPDMHISASTLLAMERAGTDASRTGLDLSADLIQRARPLVSGVVLTVPDGNSSLDDLLAVIG